MAEDIIQVQKDNNSKNKNVHSSSQTCEVTGKADPIDPNKKPIIRIEEGNKENRKNLFIGYYGIIRIRRDEVFEKDINGNLIKDDKNNNKNITLYYKYILRKHDGYDYVANVGDTVKPVGYGAICKVRFGTNTEKLCPLRVNVFNTKKEIEDEIIIKLKEKILSFLNKCIKNHLESLNSVNLKQSKDNSEKNKNQKNIINKLNTLKKQISELQKPYNELEKLIDNVKKYLKEKEKKEIKKIEEIIDNATNIKKNINDQACNPRFQSDSCGKCDQRGKCYGVQVWLYLYEEKKYAYYAHLSDISEEIRKTLIEHFKSNQKSFNNSNTIALPIIKKNNNNPLIVTTSDNIGKVGKTGNACYSHIPPHLHFECRVNNKEEKSSPNEIIKTKFVIQKKNNTNTHPTENSVKCYNRISEDLINFKWEKIKEKRKKIWLDTKFSEYYKNEVWPKYQEEWNSESEIREKYKNNEDDYKKVKFEAYEKEKSEEFKKEKEKELGFSNIEIIEIEDQKKRIDRISERNTWLDTKFLGYYEKEEWPKNKKEWENQSEIREKYKNDEDNYKKDKFKEYKKEKSEEFKKEKVKELNSQKVDLEDKLYKEFYDKWNYLYGVFQDSYEITLSPDCVSYSDQ